MTTEQQHGWWQIEVGPVWPGNGPGPGDESDASFEWAFAYGTKVQAETERERLCGKWESIHRSTEGTPDAPCWHRDMGAFGIGASLRATGTPSADTVRRVLGPQLEQLRIRTNRGDGLSQEELDHLQAEWEPHRSSLMPREKDEVFSLVDGDGNPTGLKAARWFCHLAGLPHKSVHVQLFWESPQQGLLCIFQIRAYDKADSPGHLDISAAGHDPDGTASSSALAALREMEEELGLTAADLVDGCRLVTGYVVEEKRTADAFFNVEYRDVYVAQLRPDAFGKIHFNDGEVVGLYLCPEGEAINTLNQTSFPVASALKHSLPYCIAATQTILTPPAE